jgi:hypothetical protein
LPRDRLREDRFQRVVRHGRQDSLASKNVCRLWVAFQLEKEVEGSVGGRPILLGSLPAKSATDREEESVGSRD